MSISLIAKFLSVPAVLIGLWMNGPAAAQPLVLSGRVVDAETGEALPGVHVRIEPDARRTVTDRSGGFAFSLVGGEEWSVEVSALGYDTTKRAITTAGSDSIWIDLALRPIYLELPGVEVVGDRQSVLRREAGSAVRISEAQLILARPMGTEEVLRRVPGVHVAADDGISNRVNIGIRGAYPRRSEKILLLEDGVPIQPALYLAPSAYYNPPTERIDAIEVVKNGSNVRFGAGTLSGLVNYITRRPTIRPSGTIQVLGGARGYRSVLGAVAGRLSDSGPGGELQVLYKGGDGARENTAFDVLNFTGKLQMTPTRRTTVLVKGNAHGEQAQATYAALTPYMFEQNPRQNPFEDDLLETRRYALDAHVRHTLNPNLVLFATAYGNTFRRYWWRQSTALVPATQLDPGAPADALVRIGTAGSRARLRDFAVFGLAPRLLATVHAGPLEHAVEAGLRLHVDDFLNREIDSDRPDARVRDFAAASATDLADPNGRKRVDDHYGASALAIYMQDEIRWKTLRATPGIRYEWIRQTSRQRYDRALREETDRLGVNTLGELMGMLSVALDLPRSMVYGGFYQGFLPQVSEVAFMDLIDESGVRVDASMRGERGDNLEFGMRSTHPGILRLEAAVFQNMVRNLVAAGRDADFLPVITNLGRVRYRGIEMQAGLDLSERYASPLPLMVVLSATRLDSEIRAGVLQEAGFGAADVTGNRAPYAPEWLLNVDLTAGLPGGVVFHANWDYVGDQFTDFNNTGEENAAGDLGLLPDYALLSASLHYEVPKTGATLTLAGHNLTNRIHRGSRLHRSASGIFPEGFRQLNVGIRWTR